MEDGSLAPWPNEKASMMLYRLTQGNRSRPGAPTPRPPLGLGAPAGHTGLVRIRRLDDEAHRPSVLPSPAEPPAPARQPRSAGSEERSDRPRLDTDVTHTAEEIQRLVGQLVARLGSPTGPTDGDRDREPEKLPRSRFKAFRVYQDAIRRSRETDRELSAGDTPERVWLWLQNREESPGCRKDTWCRYVRDARRVLGDPH
jgi:hypothetical protein